MLILYATALAADFGAWETTEVMSRHNPNAVVCLQPFLLVALAAVEFDLLVLRW